MKAIPPKIVQENAKKALEWKEKYDVKAGTRVGWYRATQLASGKPISKDIVKRIARFERHRKNAEYSGKPYKDKGKVMWEAWGGDEGIEWAKKQLKRWQNE